MVTTRQLTRLIHALETLSQDIAAPFDRHPPGRVRRVRRRLWQRTQALRACYPADQRARLPVLLPAVVANTLEDLYEYDLLAPQAAQHCQQFQAQVSAADGLLRLQTRENERLQTSLATLPDYQAWLTERDELREDYAVLARENAQLRARLESRPQTDSVTIPARTLILTNTTRRAVLHLMATTGLTRPWRVATLLARTQGYNEDSVKNAFTDLKNDDPNAQPPSEPYLEPYLYRGKPVKYRYQPKSRRAVYTLTPLAQTWFSHAYGQPPVPPELDEAITKHAGPEHALDILEARDRLRDLGYTVQDDPAPLCYTDDVWGPRSEPDLVLLERDGATPIEVQREVRIEYFPKWRKALELAQGRLIVILESAAAQQRQATLFRQWQRLLPAGTVRLTHLGALEELLDMLDLQPPPKVAWESIVTGPRPIA